MATGIHVGFGSPSPWPVVRRSRPSRPFFAVTVRELSNGCMTSAMIPFSDHLRTDRSADTASCGRVASCLTHVRHRGTPGSSSVSTVVSRPMELEPLP